jgi:hypothetical protein
VTAAARYTQADLAAMMPTRALACPRLSAARETDCNQQTRHRKSVLNIDPTRRIRLTCACLGPRLLDCQHPDALARMPGLLGRLPRWT